MTTFDLLVTVLTFLVGLTIGLRFLGRAPVDPERPDLSNEAMARIAAESAVNAAGIRRTLRESSPAMAWTPRQGDRVVGVSSRSGEERIGVYVGASQDSDKEPLSVIREESGRCHVLTRTLRPYGQNKF